MLVGSAGPAAPGGLAAKSRQPEELCRPASAAGLHAARAAAKPGLGYERRRASAAL